MDRNQLFNPKGKQFWFLVVLFLLGVALMVVGNRGSGAGSGPEKQPVLDQKPQESSRVMMDTGTGSVMTGEEKRLAAELCRMLEKVDGAGQVEVSVRLASSTYSNYALNASTGLKTTEEKDQSGGSRQIVENTDSKTVVLSRNEQGLEGPVLERETAPQVSGVLVVAQGAKSARVKADLFQAVQVALGVQPHKVVVLPMAGGDAGD